MATIVRADVETFFQKRRVAQSARNGNFLLPAARCPLPCPDPLAVSIDGNDRRSLKCKLQRRVGLAGSRATAIRVDASPHEGTSIFPRLSLDASHIPQRHDGRQVASVSRELDCQASSLHGCLEESRETEWLSRRAGQGQRRPAAFMHTGACMRAA